MSQFQRPFLMRFCCVNNTIIMSRDIAVRSYATEFDAF